mgnify:CR=1 FL=1
MIKIKNEEEIKLIRKACEVTKLTLEMLKKEIKPGVTTKHLDKLAYDFILSKGCKPAFKGLYGFPGTICASVNEEVVHGIPSDRVLEEGDIISIDTGAVYHGYYSDAARTFPVGKIDSDKKRLIDITEKSFFEGVKNIKAGSYVGDISSSVQKFVEKNGYSIVRELTGHGVGKELHEDPSIPNFGVKGSGARLNKNMVLAVEPMVNMGNRNVVFMPDGWTCKTLDGKPSCHYENTILITENGIEILTL